MLLDTQSNSMAILFSEKFVGAAERLGESFKGGSAFGYLDHPM